MDRISQNQCNHDLALMLVAKRGFSDAGDLFQKYEEALVEIEAASKERPLKQKRIQGIKL